MVDTTELLARLVSVEGVTGHEEKILAEAAAAGKSLGLRPEASSQGVVFKIEGDAPGPTLLFCAHLDTVPAGEGWSVPPFEATRREGHLFGRGAVDDRASCAAIMLAAAHFAAAGLPRGRFIGALSIGEEGNDPSLPKLLDDLGPVTAGIVCEPTMMNIAVAQRGLMVLELSARGTQGHASRTAGPNAIVTLARDLVSVAELRPWHEHPTLGSVKITPTRCCAGVADNVAPPVAKALLDVRTTPAHTHAEIVEMIGGATKSDVRVVADQWIPCETPPSHPLVVAAKEALPQASVYASDATSDWVFLAARNIPAIKVGPGDSVYSHAIDERIALADLESGVAGYIRLAESGFARLKFEEDG